MRAQVRKKNFQLRATKRRKSLFKEKEREINTRKREK